MKRIAFVLIVSAFATASLVAQGGKPAHKPKRINKMIEVLEAGQPVYDVTSDAGYDEGKNASSAL
jgi:hypothetical protein